MYQTPRDLHKVLAEAGDSDLIIKHSGVGADDELLEAQVVLCGSSATRTAFWDVDAPATLARVAQNPSDPFRELIPEYDFIFTYGGGDPVVEHYKRLGAKNCIPVYNALDPETRYPVTPDGKFRCDLAFIGKSPARPGGARGAVLSGRSRKGGSIQFSARWRRLGKQDVAAEIFGSIGHVRTEHHNLINSSASWC